MKEIVVNILKSIGYPVYLQGSLNPSQDYKDSFFTYWNFEAPETKHYDNRPISCSWGFWIYFYSVDPELVVTEPLKAKTELTAAGFAFEGKPMDAASDTSTHTGCMMTCRILENYKGE